MRRVVHRPLIDTPLRVRHLLVWHRDSVLDAAGLRDRAAEVYWREVAPRQDVYLRWLADHGPLDPARLTAHSD